MFNSFALDITKAQCETVVSSLISAREAKHTHQTWRTCHARGAPKFWFIVINDKNPQKRTFNTFLLKNLSFCIRFPSHFQRVTFFLPWSTRMGWNKSVSEVKQGRTKIYCARIVRKFLPMTLSMTLPFPFMTALVAQQRWQASFVLFEITTQSYNIPFVKFSALQSTNEMKRVLHLLPERWASSSLRYFAGFSVYFSGNNLTCNDYWGYSSTIVSLFISPCQSSRSTSMRGDGDFVLTQWQCSQGAFIF